MKISVIVPVYNTEKLVGKCIESILKQSFSDWELILVDDGSTDNSYSIMREYEKNDPRIKVVRQDNAGPGIARNTGIKLSNGEYLVFIDSDDIVKAHYFERLANETADVVFIDIDQVDETDNILRKEYMSEYQYLSKDDFIRGQMTGKILWGGVRKAVKAKLLKNNNIEFSKYKIGEEAIYSFLVMHYAESVSFIKGVVYEYVNRAGSQSDLKDDDPWGNIVTTMKICVQKLGLYEQYADTINAFIATATIVSLDKMAKRCYGKEYRRIALSRIEQFWNDIDRDYPIDIKHMPDKAKVLLPFLKLKWLFPIRTASYFNELRKKKLMFRK